MAEKVSDIIGSGPPSSGAPAGGKKKPSPIGVPSDFIAVKETPGRAGAVTGGARAGAEFEFSPLTQAIPPRYFEGDEFLPAQLSVEQRARLQKQMEQAGLLDSDNYSLGVWDKKSWGAYKELLTFANASGLTAEDALDQWVKLGIEAGRGGRGGGRSRPLTIHLSDPDDIRRAADTVAILKTGRAATQEEAGRIVSGRLSQEAGFQRQAHATAAAGGTVTEPPALETLAEQELQKTAGTEIDAHDVAIQFDRMLKFIGGIGG